MSRRIRGGNCLARHFRPNAVPFDDGDVEGIFQLWISDQSWSSTEKISATFTLNPGITVPPVSVCAFLRMVNLEGDVKTLIVRVGRSTYHTSSTPASNKSPSLRDISCSVLDLLRTSTARFGAKPGIGSRGGLPPGSRFRAMNDMSGIRTSPFASRNIPPSPAMTPSFVDAQNSSTDERS